MPARSRRRCGRRITCAKATEIVQAIDAKSDLAKTWLVATTFPNEWVEPSRAAIIREQALHSLQELGTINDL